MHKLLVNNVDDRARYEIKAKHPENESVREYVVGIVNVYVHCEKMLREQCCRNHRRSQYKKQRGYLESRLNHFEIFSYSARRFSMRRSGISQMMATVT